MIKIPLPRQLLLFVTVLLSACSEHPHGPINIAGNQWLGYQPLFIAYETGMKHHSPYTEHQHDAPLSTVAHDFTITMLPSTSGVLRMLSNQQLDGALMTLDEAIQYQAKTGMALCVPLVMDYSNGADALIVNPQTFINAKDKKIKIGYEATALGGYMMRRSIEVLGLSPENIVPVIVEPSHHFRSYESGRVDAMITFSPYLDKIKNIGGEILFSSKDIPQEIMDLLVIRTDIWHQRKTEINHLIDTLWSEGLNLVKNPDPETSKMIQGMSGMSPEEFNSSMQDIHLITAEENKTLLHEKFQASVDLMSEYLVENNLIAQPSTLAPCK